MSQSTHTPDHIDTAVEQYIDACSGDRSEILSAIAAEGFHAYPAIDDLDPESRRDAVRRVERGDYDR